MTLATLSIDLVAKLAKMEADLGKAVRLNEQAASSIEKKWAAVGQSFAALGAGISVAGITAYFRAVTDGIDKLNDVADATGATVESISQLEDVALRTGSSIDTVETALVKMNQALASARDGSNSQKVLDAIGLSAKELRAQDPAQALQSIAVALNKYEADGNKARIVQELFGKSLKEVAPLLKDLAENGLRAASVSTKQAEEAEKLNKQLFELQKNSLDLARSVASELIPTLNQAFGMFNKLREGPGILQSVVEALKGNVFSSASEGATHYAVELGKVNRELDAIASGKSSSKSIYGADRIAPLKEEQARLEKLVKYYQAIQTGAGGGRGDVSQLTESKKAAPDVASILSDKGTPAKPEIPKEFLDAAGQAREALARMIDDTPSQKLAKLNLQMQQLEVLAKAGLDPRIVTELRTALQGLDTVEIPEGIKQLRDELNTMFDESKQGKVDKYNALLAEANAQFTSGAMSAEKFWAVTDKISGELAKLDKEQEVRAAEWSVFWEEAAKNIQDVLGDGLYDILNGSFNNIGRSFETMLKKMAAQAMAADLANSLFGALQKDGTRSGGGWIDQGISWLSSTFGGGRASGGPVSAGSFYEVNEGGMPEMLTIGNRNLLMMGSRPGVVTPVGRSSGGGSVTVVINQTVGEIVTPSQLAAVAEQTRRAAVSAVADARSRGRMA